MIATQGGRFMGFGFYVLGGRLTYTYNYFDQQRTTVTSGEAIAPGRHKLAVDFRYASRRRQGADGLAGGHRSPLLVEVVVGHGSAGRRGPPTEAHEPATALDGDHRRHAWPIKSTWSLDLGRSRLSISEDALKEGDRAEGKT